MNGDSTKLDKDKPSAGNVGIHINGNVSGSQVIGAGGDVLIEGGFQASSVGSDLSEAFKEIYQKIEARPADPNVEKSEIAENVRKIEAEVQKGEEGNVSLFEMRLKMLAAMAPDIAEVVAATITSPIAGISVVFQKIAQKAKAEMVAKPGLPGQ